MPTTDYSKFHNAEPLIDTPAPIGCLESLRNFVGALWRHRQQLRSGGVMGRVKAILPELPLNDPAGKFISNQVMHMLWGSMLHPPQQLPRP